MDNNFIDQFDPTKNIEKDLATIDLKDQFTNLTEHEKLLVFCKIHGYNRVPPSIQRLYSDDYYLGGEKFFDHGNNLFQFWKDSLPTIFPNEVFTAKPFLVLSGAIGIGKSTISRLCLAETYARMLCMKNPSRTLKLSPKPFSAVIFHRSEETAIIEFKNWFNREVLEFSPFFKNITPNFKFKIITSGPRGGGGLGSDVVFFLMGEINFWDNQESAQGRVSSSLIRFTSRFNDDAITKVGQFIIDSSAKGSSSVTNWFLDNTDPKLTWNCAPSHWAVKPQDYQKSNGKTFSVYSGDGLYPPQILPEDYKLGFDQDPDKVLKVPIQLLPEFKTSIYTALMDKAGVSVSSNDNFFGGTVEHLKNCSTIRNRIPEVVVVDFYDKTDRLISKVEPMISILPRGTFGVLGLDLGVTSDITGLAFSSFDHWEIVNDTKLPRFRCHFLLGVSRKEGQQTSLFHIFDLILALKKRFNIVVSADQAFSRQILQDCEREGIKTLNISTDNSPSEPSLYAKNIINNELLEVPVHKRLQREAYDLKYVTTKTGKSKVDHPKKATQNPTIFDNNNGVGSKDIWDALCQSLYGLKQFLDEGEEMGYSESIKKQLDSLSKITSDPREESQKEFQGMLENIF